MNKAIIIYLILKKVFFSFFKYLLITAYKIGVKEKKGILFSSIAI